MKKGLLWMMAAIFTCGFLFSSCSNNEDNPVPKPLPDQAAMFIQNVLSDSRYYPDMLEIGADGETAKYLRLDVADYDEAKKEFLKLLPEGVAATAHEGKFYQGLFTESTVYYLNAPQQNTVDSIAFQTVNPIMNQLVGLAWVDLPDDLEEALDVDFIIYMLESSNDDLENFIQSLIAIMPYSKPDPEDPTHLICNIKKGQEELVASFLTTKMMSTAVITENGMELTLTDAAGNSYGKMTVLNRSLITEGSVLVFDETLQASMAAVIGGAFSKISFFLNNEESMDTPLE